MGRNNNKNVKVVHNSRQKAEIAARNQTLKNLKDKLKKQAMEDANGTDDKDGDGQIKEKSSKAQEDLEEAKDSDDEQEG